MTMYQLYPEKNDRQTTLGEAISDVVNEDEEELKFLRDKIIQIKVVKKHYMKIITKDPDKVLTGIDYTTKNHHFNLKRCSLKNLVLQLLRWVIFLQC